MGLVRRDTHILLKAVLALETGQLLVDLVGLELAAGDSISSPYCWFDLLLTPCIFALLPATGKAVEG